MLLLLPFSYFNLQPNALPNVVAYSRRLRWPPSPSHPPFLPPAPFTYTSWIPDEWMLPEYDERRKGCRQKLRWNGQREKWREERVSRSPRLSVRERQEKDDNTSARWQKNVVLRQTKKRQVICRGWVINRCTNETFNPTTTYRPPLYFFQLLWWVENLLITDVESCNIKIAVLQSDDFINDSFVRICLKTKSISSVKQNFAKI